LITFARKIILVYDKDIIYIIHTLF
jgi:hypothetical protein